jgi:hypothetical protein
MEPSDFRALTVNWGFTPPYLWTLRSSAGRRRSCPTTGPASWRRTSAGDLDRADLV